MRLLNISFHVDHQKISYIAGWDGASTQRDREAGFSAGLAPYAVFMRARLAINNHEPHKQPAHKFSIQMISLMHYLSVMTIWHLR